MMINSLSYAWSLLINSFYIGGISLSIISFCVIRTADNQIVLVSNGSLGNRKRNFGNSTEFQKPPRLFQKCDNKRFHTVSYSPEVTQWNITWNFLLSCFRKSLSSFWKSAVLPRFQLPIFRLLSKYWIYLENNLQKVVFSFHADNPFIF